MLRKYNKIIGPITNAILTGSMVGVIIAEIIAITTTAMRQCRKRSFALTIPIPANPKTIKGNWKAIPIQNNKLVTNLMYDAGRIAVGISMKSSRNGKAVGIITKYANAIPATKKRKVIGIRTNQIISLPTVSIPITIKMLEKNSRNSKR